MPKPAAEKPRGAAAPVTPIQKGSLTMRKRNFNINVRVTVYKLLKSGKIRTIKVGKRYIIPKRCVSEFLESC